MLVISGQFVFSNNAMFLFWTEKYLLEFTIGIAVYNVYSIIEKSFVGRKVIIIVLWW